MHKDAVVGVPDFSETAMVAEGGINITKVEGLGSREQWEQSPERPMSLLPAFGVGQPSHLPTPQSPNNLSGYMIGHAESPLSSDHPRAGPSRQFQALRPPSRPESAHPPKTPQRGSSASTPHNRLRSPPPTSQPDFEYNLFRHAEMETETLQPNSSQIATPSPEISRTRHASVPYTPSDSETMLATPIAGRRSSSHPYTGPTTLAPAPIISPANSSHSTVYHASPTANQDTIRAFKFPHSMAALVSDDNLRNRESIDLADPFIVRDDERGQGEMSRQYPSPPALRRHTRRTSSPLLMARVADPGPSEDSITRPAVSLPELSDGSPVKTEVEDDDISGDIAHSPVIHGLASPRAPTSPRTPRPAEYSKGLVSRHRTPSLDDPTFHTPLRVSGGEIDRIRQHQADLKDARTMESERRRPEYLVRSKRARSNADDEAAQRERENALPGLGVTVSPVKGRRLKLYQPVAVTPGAIVEGGPELEDDDTVEPKTPPPLSRTSSGSAPPRQSTIPTMSMRAIDWRTPGRGRSSPVPWSEEDEIKKHKRLAAFAAPQESGRRRRLKPVEVVGQGRMIVDVTSPETRELAEAGIVQIPESDTPDDDEVVLADGHGAEWPDNQYPWSLQEQRRDEQEEAERRKRLRWIERFLDRESESDEDDTERMASPSIWTRAVDSNIPSGSHRGRGKTISLNAVPGSRRSTSSRLVAFGASNADAHDVLLSKKHVREVAERIRRRKVAEEEEGVVMCICQGADDGRPMVRCDECRTWYHLVCMDIENEDELGDEWYCWKCVPSAEDAPPAPVSEPTFAPVVPDSPPRTSAGDLPLYQSALQPSPMLDMRSRAPVSPSVPLRRTRDGEPSPGRRSRLPHPVGDPGDPVRGGPSTPYQPRSTDSRLYSTPKFYDEYAADEFIPFDPTSTPSRGLKFPHAVPITPRRPHPWTPAQAHPWMTPSGPPRTPQFSSQAGSSSTRSLTYSLSTLEDSGEPPTSPWPSEESPIRRPHKAGQSMWPHPPRALDSPLAVRGVANRPAYLPGIEESPTARLFHRGKDRDLDEFTSRPSQGQSPRRE